MQWNKDTLKEARTSAKLSQFALAEALGVHHRTRMKPNLDVEELRQCLFRKRQNTLMR